MPNFTIQPYRYFVYVRKSSESAERQALSIDSQIESLLNQFGACNIIEVLKEQKTAFKPYKRAVLTEMLQRIENGEADGIICWHPDRLSRNSMEAGHITQLLQDGVLKDLKFGSYHFMNSPDGIMMLQMALSQSQYYSSKLSVDVKRGLETKLQAGWRPNVAPQGYLNDYQATKGKKIIKVDPERFGVLRKAWEMMLTGMYSIGYINNILNNEWGFRTRRMKSVGGKKLSNSGLHRIFRNKFYAGILALPSGVEQVGKHKAMVSVDEFEKIQILLSSRKRGSKRNHKKNLDFTYKPLLACGECGGTVTAERKFKQLKKGTQKEYIYYHCTHNKKEANCKQGSIEERLITEQLLALCKKIQIKRVFKDWANDILDELEEKEQAQEKQTAVKRQNTIQQLETKLKRLNQMYLENLITTSEFSSTRQEIYSDLTKLKMADRQNMLRQKSLSNTYKKVFEMAFEGVHILQSEPMEVKRNLLNGIASNFLIQDKKLAIALRQWFVEIEKYNNEHQLQIECFEPKQTPIPSELTGIGEKLYSSWRRVVDEIRTIIRTQNKLKKQKGI